MAVNNFCLKDSFRSGWKTLAGNIGIILKLSLILIGIFLLGLLLNIIFNQLITPELGWLGIVFSVIFAVLMSVVSIFFQMRLIALSFALLKGDSFTIKDFFSMPQSRNMLAYFFIGLFLYSLIIQAGILLLVVPGIIWTFKYCMVPFVIVDRNMSPIDALKESGRLTKGVKLKLFIFYLFIIVLGIFSLVIPVFLHIICLFFASICLANIYTQLKDCSGMVDKV